MNAPQQPQPAGRPVDRSLQININSEDDAKAVIQHLGLIKKTWDTLADTAGITSIEFCIAETIRRKVDGFLMGAVNWCRTYTKSIAPFEGNVHFPLPHYMPVQKPPTLTVVAQPLPEPAKPEPKPNRYLRGAASEPNPTPTLGKTERPVPAPGGGT